MTVEDRARRNRGRWRLMRAWVRDEKGSATIEAALWIPFFILLLALIADASFLFNRQAQMLRSVQDVNRAFSTGQIGSTAQVEAILAAQFAGTSQGVRVQSTLDSGTVPGGIIRTSLSIPARDLVSIGIISGLTNLNITVVSAHYREL